MTFILFSILFYFIFNFILFILFIFFSEDAGILASTSSKQEVTALKAKNSYFGSVSSCSTGIQDGAHYFRV